jgi:hypothetical protein
VRTSNLTILILTGRGTSLVWGRWNEMKQNEIK